MKLVLTVFVARQPISMTSTSLACTSTGLNGTAFQIRVFAVAFVISWFCASAVATTDV